MGSDDSSEVLHESGSFLNSSTSVVDEAGATDSEAADAYDDDGFDEYSDSFEADDDGDDDDGSPVEGSSAAGWAVGDRVQVFWPDEAAWFDGAVHAATDARHLSQCLVHYDDGDVAWEDISMIRSSPREAVGGVLYEQLQLVLPSLPSVAMLVGRSVAAYWPQKLAWFSGTVTAAQDEPPAVLIAYENGDTRWEQGDDLRQLVLLSDYSKLPPRPPSEQSPAPLQPPPSPVARLLTPRAYCPVVTHHFQPVRIARPYRCSFDRHISSVLEPRSNYTSRLYLHGQLDCTAIPSNTSLTSDAAVQTTVDATSTQA